jgi:hypothetical protein
MIQDTYMKEKAPGINFLLSRLHTFSKTVGAEKKYLS